MGLSHDKKEEKMHNFMVQSYTSYKFTLGLFSQRTHVSFSLQKREIEAPILKNAL